MSSEVAEFSEYLRTQGLKLTTQRESILRRVLRIKKHFSADQLFEALRKDRAGISKATVYRTLSLLSEGGFIEALDLGRDQGTLYEHVMGHDHHDHMVCLTCGRIIEFHDDELERVQDEAVRRHGFQASSHKLNVYGTCARCAKAGAGKAAQDGR